MTWVVSTLHFSLFICQPIMCATALSGDECFDYVAPPFAAVCFPSLTWAAFGGPFFFRELLSDGKVLASENQ
jgi:hypothetical protein